MDNTNLSPKAKFELVYIIYRGISDAIDNNKMEKEVLEELLNWYKSNAIINYNHLKEKFTSIK